MTEATEGPPPSEFDEFVYPIAVVMSAKFYRQMVDTLSTTADELTLSNPQKIALLATVGGAMDRAILDVLKRFGVKGENNDDPES